MIAFILHFCRSKLIAPLLSVFAGKTVHSIAIKKPFLFSFNYFGSICNKGFGCLMDIKEHFGCQQT